MLDDPLLDAMVSLHDDYGFRYTTREMFDAFYPGYGSQWPTLRGGIGILWEQAGVRGLVIGRGELQASAVEGLHYVPLNAKT